MANPGISQNMDAKDFARQLRDIVNDLKKKGVESINSDNLVKYLDEALQDLSTSSRPSDETIERYKAELQKWVEEHRFIHAQSVEMFRSVIQAGQNALRTAFLMNGGASVALLAFIGHLANVAQDEVPSLAPSLTIFVGGVLVSAFASGVTYLSQWFYGGGQSWTERVGFALNIIAILSGLGAYGLFAFGMWHAYGVFANFGPQSQGL